MGSWDHRFCTRGRRVAGGLLGELEGGVGAVAVDAAGDDEAADAEVAGEGDVAHLAHLADEGDVVVAVVAGAGVGQPGYGGENDDGGDGDLGRFGRGLPWS